ncbi:MAG TPA: DUF86 domain-containing protein [Desulfomonilia bacterium]
MQRELAHLLDILTMANDAISFTSGMNKEAFSKDRKTQYAVIRCLEVIGEAAKRIPDDFRNAHPEVPWKQLTEMRDILIHSYDKVNVDIVWETVEKDLPDILNKLSPIIKP